MPRQLPANAAIALMRMQLLRRKLGVVGFIEQQLRSLPSFQRRIAGQDIAEPQFRQFADFSRSSMAFCRSL